MEQNRTGFSDDKIAGNDNRRSQTREATTVTDTVAEPQSYGKRWSSMQFSKGTLAWICLAAIVATMFVGFSWGGWVTGGSAEKAAESMADSAVVDRLALICVAQFQQDPDHSAKLVELKAAGSFQQRTYVSEQGWATMPGDEKSDNNVATECAKQLVMIE